MIRPLLYRPALASSRCAGNPGTFRGVGPMHYGTPELAQKMAERYAARVKALGLGAGFVPCVVVGNLLVEVRTLRAREAA